ncbi:hypothetical protein [Glaciibacter flavus]|uniref:hypothetical protein n=1 Tax=Orlajensenia flava TaxID=2565934 RepID=UPI003B00076F
MASALIRGERIEIEPEAAAQLAAWSVAMAFVLGESHDEDCHFTPEEIRHLQDFGVPSDKTIVAFAWIFPLGLARSDGLRWQPIWPYSNFQHSVDPLNEPGEIVYLWLGRLCVIVATQTGIPIIGRRLGTFAKHIPVLWPNDGEAIQWPPASEVPMYGLETALNGGRGASTYLADGLNERDENSRRRRLAQVAAILERSQSPRA